LTALRIYRHADLPPSGFTAMRIYRQADLPPCGFTAKQVNHYVDLLQGNQSPMSLLLTKYSKNSAFNRDLPAASISYKILSIYFKQHSTVRSYLSNLSGTCSPG